MCWLRMTDVRFYKASRNDAEVLAKDMRAADIEEVRAAGQTPLQSLLESLESSDMAYTVRFNGHVAFMFGVAPLPKPETALGTAEVGWAWLLTGNQCNHLPKTFLRQRDKCMRLLLDKHPTIVGFVWSEYRGALRMLQRIGFKSGGTVEFQPGNPFVAISIRRDSWVQ